MLDSKDIEILESLFVKSENAILKELERTRTELHEQMDRLEKNMELMQHQINAVKIETENVNLFLRIVDNLQKRIEVLESKIA